MKRLPIGISDYKKLIENDYYFVDTTKMISDVCNESADILLITRPRRFGKTLNMSMLRYFFDKQLNSKNLFTDYEIAKEPNMLSEMNTLPVIYLTFKDINDREWEVCEDHLKNLFRDLYKEKERELSELRKDKDIESYYRNIIEKTAGKADYKDALKNLILYLKIAYEKPVLLIIDEYDVPIQSGWLHGYYDDIIDMMKGILSGALKDNSNLFKGILTGIYRVAKESIFSGLNNLKVYTIFDEKYSEYFGFSSSKLDILLSEIQLENPEEIKTQLKNWYNGYKIGNETIYNPWSVVNSLNDNKYKPYWINTSSNNLIIDLIEKNLKEDDEFKKNIEALISGHAIFKIISDSTALRDIEYDINAIWALFLFSGYLKVESLQEIDGNYNCNLIPPNKEVFFFFKNTVITWLNRANRNTITYMTDALIKGDIEEFCQKLEKYVMDTLSFYDIKGEPENTYHLLLLGMFSHLQDSYYIKSNRESGKGRYDILLKSKDKRHFSSVIEIKPSAKDTDNAFEQIEEKAYTQELLGEGYTKILKVALGVDGKNIKTKIQK